MSSSMNNCNKLNIIVGVVVVAAAIVAAVHSRLVGAVGILYGVPIHFSSA